jgi:hypothetical protein
MTDLKNKTVKDILSDQVLKNELKEGYLKELRGFEKENNKDPYTEIYTCTEVITEVQNETELGLKCLSSFIQRAINVDNGWDDLEDFPVIKL